MEEAYVLTNLMSHYLSLSTQQNGTCNVQIYSLYKGLNKLKDKGKKAAKNRATSQLKNI